MRILVAEDDASLAEGLRQSLRHAGYAVDSVRNGEDAEAALAAGGFDLLILDIGLPRKSGLEVLRRLRRRDSVLPVLILTGLDRVSDRVAGLDAGADDYLVKPFEFAELQARVRALARRGLARRSSLMTYGPLSYDQIGRTLRLNGVPVDLSARETGLLEALLRRVDGMISKDQLVNHLCEWGDEISANAIEVYIHRLRKKLEPAGVQIVTVRGIGYMLRDPAIRPARDSAPQEALAFLHSPDSGTRTT